MIDACLEPWFPHDLFRFTARVDFVTDYSVWELKCTSEISTDHLLQVVIYAWLWRMTQEKVESWDRILDFKIFNIKTGEMFRLEATTEVLTQIMVALLQGKYMEKEKKEDMDFVQECKNILEKG
jgi:hypothetical protein